MRIELEGGWNETRWLLRRHEGRVNNVPEEYCPSVLLLIPPDYADNLGRRSKMAIKGILPPPLKIILNIYYPLRSPPQLPRPSPQCAAPPRRPSVQSPPQQQCSVTRVVKAEKTTVERSAERACMEESTEGKMNPELGGLESSSAGTGSEAPGQQCLSNWEMERTTVDDCSLVDGSSDFGETTFSLEEFVIETQTDSQTLASFASSKVICQKMTRKPKDKKLANKENKQFDPGEKVGKPSLWKADVHVLLFLGDAWAWMSGLFP